MQTNNNNFNNFNRYYNLFQQNKLNNEIAFIPFITLGDPNFELSFKILDAKLLIYSQIYLSLHSK